MAGLHGDQDNGYSSLEDENDAAPPEQTHAMVIEAALARLRVRAGCQEDSFVRRLSTSLLSRMARSIFRRWESTRRSADVERVPDFLELVTEELCRFAQRVEIAEEYERRNSRGSMEHDELEEQRRRERSDYRLSPRRRFSLSLSTEDPTLDLDILQPVRVRSSPDDSPMSPQRGLTDPEEMRSYQRTENVRVHRRRRSKHLAREAEKEERRRHKKSVESSKSASSLEASMSPKKTDSDGEPENSGEVMRSDLKQKELDASLLKAEPSGELHSSGEAKVSEDLAEKPLINIIALDAADAASTLQSSVEHARTEDLEIKSLGSSITSSISDSTSVLQCSEGSITREISKNGTSQNSDLPSTGSGTSISSEVDNVGAAQKPELPSTETEKNITPEESSTPSNDLLPGIEDNPPVGAQETGARPKVPQKDKERRKKRTRQVIESLSNRQLTSLSRLEITTTDVLEMLIQLSVSLDRLDRLINGSRNRGSDDVDEGTLAQFFEGLEYARTREISNRILREDLDDSQSSRPGITENPLRDPKDEA